MAIHGAAMNPWPPKAGKINNAFGESMMIFTGFIGFGRRGEEEGIPIRRFRDFGFNGGERSKRGGENPKCSRRRPEIFVAKFWGFGQF